MKRIELKQYGVPEDVARCVEAPDVGPPGAGEVVFDVLAFPINPADLAFCTGNYRIRPPPPAIPGAECVGRIASVGAGVEHISPGDLVINLERENWAERRRVAAESVVVIPAGIDPYQAAMMRINPPTALLLLTDIVELSPGDWIIQNVANSAVGKLMIALAKARGVRTLNVARRDDVFDELRALGGDACLLDGADLAGRVQDLTGGSPVKLGLDAVSGEATGRIAACVDEGATVCTYGAMSGEDPRMPLAEVIFRGVKLTGFMLGKALQKRSPAEVSALYSAIAQSMLEGSIQIPVQAVYPISDIRGAIICANGANRGGKVLVAPSLGRPASAP